MTGVQTCALPICEIAQGRDLTIVRSSSPNLVTLEGERTFQTVEDYVFVLGEDEPAIDIPEVEFHA